ncbi:AAA family ATPase [Pseudoflavonifractor sp. 524-17]|uniref:shikimate kinase n=1 Tax=Pseudoflavonifractor sp. 524-17 TaxID=2304577 RepID=UPI00137B8361|nr:shikimate kinase [Pseudoflavonifractor sp. 524-17]NCE65856.1 AAA family ATPase [Pseudoflavonifractor sp. 524-17]
MRKNLVLIGMPGCGKTAVGRVLAEKLGMPLVDTDDLVEQEAGRSIPELFDLEGEEGFRERESAAARKAAALDGAIIATGGGMVLRPENMAVLSRTGIVFFRDRSLEAILGEDHSGRPLVGEDSQRLRRLYDQRIALYRRYAQYTIGDAQAEEKTAALEEIAGRIAAIYCREENR